MNREKFEDGAIDLSGSLTNSIGHLTKNDDMLGKIVHVGLDNVGNTQKLGAIAKTIRLLLSIAKKLARNQVII